MGNRGILHDECQRIIRSSRNRMWLICLLDFKGRKRAPMSPGTYTELFFLDEAVALAAGHRPCGECRRAAYRAYISAANVGNRNPIGGASELDRQLNTARNTPRVSAPLAALPDGVFVALGDKDSRDFRLIWAGRLHRWSPGGYLDPIAIDEAGTVAAPVLTPALSVAALRHGYPVTVHPSLASAG